MAWAEALATLCLPAPGQYGALRVAMAASAEVPLFGRQLLLDTPVPWTLVYENATLWMSDTPQERLMMRTASTNMGGAVLVAGGGLGMFPQYLLRHGQPTSITLVERHPDVRRMLAPCLDALPALAWVQTSLQAFLGQPRQFDSAFIDIHPTIDPRWIPGLNWLRNQCAPLVRGPLRIWGYAWMLDAFVAGLAHNYVPLLEQQQTFDDPLGHDLARCWPPAWPGWAPARRQQWLYAYAHTCAWPDPALDPQ